MFELHPLPPDKRHIESFNDLALQWVSDATLARLDDDFWQPGDDEPGQEARAGEGPGSDETLEAGLEKLSI